MSVNLRGVVIGVCRVAYRNPAKNHFLSAKFDFLSNVSQKYDQWLLISFFYILDIDLFHLLVNVQNDDVTCC